MSSTRFDHMQQRIHALDQVAAWPEMQDLVDRAVHQECRSIWDYPFLACKAVGGAEDDALPGAAAVFCTMASVHLVDDILDDDPLGDYHRLGTGYAANLALAFQAAAHCLLGQAALDSHLRALLQVRLAGVAFATAVGQAMDSRHVTCEAEYWRVVDAKTPPLLGGALYVGALLGGASEEVALSVERLGHVLGRYIQVSDDLADAMETPARADWLRPMNSLPILYASTVEHPERAEFLALRGGVADPAVLAEAQHILVRSGAVSYCVYKMTQLSEQARALLAATPLADHDPLEHLLALQIRPVERLLARIEAEAPVLLELG